MKTWKKLAVASAALFGAAIATPAMAIDLGGIADKLTTQTTSVNTLLTVVAFVLGVAMAVAGLMKFRAHSQNPNDPSNKMSTAFILMFVGAGLVAIPSVLGSGVETIFGSGASTTNAADGFGTSIN